MVPKKTNMHAASPNGGFRSDINGLRAWAVIAVILYHFGVPGFSGGFVGVDVFFVISGYLMASIVIKGLEQGSFSILAFYDARIRRIVPALLMVCALLLAAGYFVLSPSDYKLLATHAISALGFFSNFKLWDEAGYFDVSSLDKWLLHTWSLSVEWQFYLLLPILLSLVWRVKPGRLSLIFVIVCGVVLSLSLSVVLTASYPTTAFYLLPTRAWEMLGGGLVFMFSSSVRPAVTSGKWMEASGLALIITSIWALDSETQWPGWHATLPVLGSMLILMASRQASLFTGSRIPQWIGDRSYSLYLWHWPVVVALAYSELQHDTPAVVAGIVLTIALGDISCRWVENPSRRWLGKVGLRKSMTVMAISLIVVLLPAAAVRLGDGIKGRLDPLVESIAAEAGNFNPRRDFCHSRKGNSSPSCVWGGAEWKVIALGDSHISAVVSALAAVRENAGVVQWSYSGCSFVVGLKNKPEIGARLGSDYHCEEFVEWARQQLVGVPPDLPVVILNRYAAQAFGANENRNVFERPEVYFSKIYDRTSPEFLEEFGQHIIDTACEIAISRHVYLVRPIPEMGFDVPKTLSRRLAFGIRKDVSIPIEEYRRRNEWVWKAQDAAARQCGVSILDPTAYLCDAERCFGSRNLQSMYMDDDHLSETGNKLLTPMFNTVFENQQ
ncbi:MAG: acyltransferase [Betaproteobacteria bacterium HGW-Betaproteobacteria-6]|jgi:peptidoglycan/LPS O-acetylase OafA/YrhL|uniref:Acyltransferase n=1 Tax=Candidatus Anoxymicrobium japonicum TaxID=2013648 RepID=A0A2N3G5Q0_9ACTN|nr:MAG: acyltransferase [Betaproteobacteria bacterium HGW-Betaproteobacteria-6]PKQ28047.1 MAG: acyltransferase [Candidatus Anoxymicrobium japonicum]